MSGPVFNIRLPYLLRGVEGMPETLQRHEEILMALECLAEGVAAGWPGAYRVAAKTLAREAGMIEIWDGICRRRGLRVL